MPATATTPYQAALDAVQAKGGKKVTVEPGTRRVASRSKSKAPTLAKVKAAAKPKAAAPKPQTDLRPRDAKLYTDAIYAVACPTCNAAKSRPCREPAGPRAPHAKRVAAAKAK
jgi:hypothetical protein